MSKISDDLFLVISQNFTENYLPKISNDLFFSHFSQFLLLLYLFLLNIFPDAPLILDAVLHFLRIYPYFFHIYLCIFSENSVVGCPRLHARGRRTPRTPLSNYATIWSLYLRKILTLTSCRLLNINSKLLL